MLEELDVLVLFNTFGTFFDLQKSNKKEPEFHFDADVKKMKYATKGGFAAEPELDIFVFLEILFSNLAILANLANLANFPDLKNTAPSKILDWGRAS